MQRKSTSRRQMLQLAAGAGLFTFWRRKAQGFTPTQASFVELAAQAKAATAKNLYAELGSLARMMRTDPTRYAVLIGDPLDGFGPDHIMWGTDTPVIGPPRWQSRPFRASPFPRQ